MGNCISKRNDVRSAAIKKLALNYAFVDGSHHKQWALVEIAKLVGAQEDELPDSEDRGMPD
jgi:hypothetical protein